MGGRFEGQVVIVTGGGRGIGRATALEFATEGATLVLAGRRMDALRTAAAEAAHSGGKPFVVSCDVLSDSELGALVQTAMERHGRIDVLVNNAGVVTGGRLDEIGKDDIDRMVGVNVWAPMRLTQLALPHMRAAKSGTIVNISSFAGRVGTPYYAVYSATKFALRGFSEALRREVRPDGIQVCAVYPGVTATDMLETAEFPQDLGMSVATAEQVGKAVIRGVRWRVPEVFVGIGESIISRVNDVMPWSIDVGVDLMRERFQAAVRTQRTT